MVTALCRAVNRVTVDRVSRTRPRALGMDTSDVLGLRISRVSPRCLWISEEATGAVLAYRGDCRRTLQSASGQSKAT